MLELETLFAFPSCHQMFPVILDGGEQCPIRTGEGNREQNVATQSCQYMGSSLLSVVTQLSALGAERGYIVQPAGQVVGARRDSSPALCRSSWEAALLSSIGSVLTQLAVAVPAFVRSGQSSTIFLFKQYSGLLDPKKAFEGRGKPWKKTCLTCAWSLTWTRRPICAQELCFSVDKSWPWPKPALILAAQYSD